MNLSTVKWAQWDKTQSRELLVCSYVCASHCAQLLHTILHRTDLIIFPLTLQTITTAPMMSTRGKGGRSGLGRMTKGSGRERRLIDWKGFNIPLYTLYVIWGTGFCGSNDQPTLSLEREERTEEKEGTKNVCGTVNTALWCPAPAVSWVESPRLPKVVGFWVSNILNVQFMKTTFVVWMLA